MTITPRDSAYYELRQPISQGDEAFSGRLPKLFINFFEIFPRVYRNLEEQNKVLEPSVIIINYCIIIITSAYYNYIV